VDREMYDMKERSIYEEVGDEACARFECGEG